MEIIQELGKSYLIVNRENEEKYMCGMLSSNNIKGILSCKQGLFENRNVLKYDITNMRSLSREYENRQMEGSEAAGLLLQIADSIKEGEAYLLTEKYFVFDPEYIFIDLIDDAINLLCLPIIRRDENEFTDGRYQKLSEFLIDKINHKDELAVDIAYNFYRLSKEPLFSLDNFCEMNIANDKAGKNSLKPVYDKEAVSISAAKEPDYESYGRVNHAPVSGRKNESSVWRNTIIYTCIFLLLSLIGLTILRKSVCFVYVFMGAFLFLILSLVSLLKNLVQIISIRKNEHIMPSTPVDINDYWYEDKATQFFDADGTQFFDENTAKNAGRDIYMLVWNDGISEQTEIIRAFPCVIGKKYEEVDICISDATVSRTHATIYKKGHDLYIRDENSTNGTFVMEKRITNRKGVRLTPDSDIRLGKVEARLVLQN